MAISSFTAGSAITAGDAVYLSSGNLLYPSIASSSARTPVIGIALDTAAAGSLVRVDNDGVYAQSSNLIPGEDLYVSPVQSGTLVSSSGFYEQLYGSPLFRANLSRVGRSISTSGYAIELKPPVLINIEGYFTLETGTPHSIGVILLEDGFTLELESST